MRAPIPKAVATIRKSKIGRYCDGIKVPGMTVYNLMQLIQIVKGKIKIVSLACRFALSLCIIERK